MNSIWLGYFAIAVAGVAITACNPKTRVTSERNSPSAGTARAPSGPELHVEGTLAFDGEWGFASDCDFGHYITLGLKRSGNTVAGDWSDGTRVRGSQGELRGEIRKGELTLQRCNDGTSAGGEPECPAFQESHDTLVQVGSTLVWYHVYDGERTRYVVLERAPATSPRNLGCENDQEDQG